jgi:hypothetical protein
MALPSTLKNTRQPATARIVLLLHMRTGRDPGNTRDPQHSVMFRVVPFRDNDVDASSTNGWTPCDFLHSRRKHRAIVRIGQVLKRGRTCGRTDTSAQYKAPVLRRHNIRVSSTPAN